MQKANPSVFSPTIVSNEDPFLFIDEAAEKPAAKIKDSYSGYEVGYQNNVLMNSYMLIHFNTAAFLVYVAKYS